MVNKTVIGSLALCTLLTLGGSAGAQAPQAGPAASAANNNQITVPFSDPSRPGTVKVSLLNGSISVKPHSGRDVIVTTDSERDDDRGRERTRTRDRGRGGSSSNDDPAAGLRRLTQPAGVNVEEENNTVTINSPALLGHTNITLQVPPATSVVLRTVNGGEVSVEGITGSIEVNDVNGNIRLTDVSGAVIAHATNGGVKATLRQLPSGKPMSFTSFNGDVDVTLPASLKANLKLRSDRGDVYTDFDVQPTQQSPRAQGGADDRRDGSRGPNRDGRDRPDPKDRAKYRVEMDRSIYGMVNGGGPDFELRTFNGDIYLRKAR